jgi:hypothetical protein
VETRGGGDTWVWELNDPTPELRILGGRLRGIRGWTPRLSFSGPLIGRRLYLSEAVEYSFKKTPVRTLPFPYNEQKRESWNSLTRLDYVASPSQLLTVKLHAAPQRLLYYGLGFYNPQPVTPNFWGHEGMADVSHKMAIAGGLAATAISVSQVAARVAGQGAAGLVMTPAGNLGNYFLRQDRRARKVEVLENWTARPAGSERKHHVKAGFSVLGVHARGSYFAHPISIAGAGQQLLGRIQFENRAGYRTSDWETDLYAHDHWVLSPAVSLDAGLRFERQQLTRGEQARSAGRHRLVAVFQCLDHPPRRRGLVLRSRAADRVRLRLLSGADSCRLRPGWRHTRRPGDVRQRDRDGGE